MGARGGSVPWAMSVVGVLGVEDLRVADASVFPVGAANTRLSAVLVGETIAELMRQGIAPAVTRALEDDRWP